MSSKYVKDKDIDYGLLDQSSLVVSSAFVLLFCWLILAGKQLLGTLLLSVGGNGALQAGTGKT